ncbi:unnamed protein product [Cyprideis torosa]|uniref:Uncharacterized protein n=1 Tax=Cyprideis torosa TaxID=163714 RepID=A0A7R8WFA6_9CRUS|nr:unnamed protein product [Cyprideis torosa]CAG0896626.1 unnamed protein product [Cyprideis torosa]
MFVLVLLLTYCASLEASVPPTTTLESAILRRSLTVKQQSMPPDRIATVLRITNNMVDHYEGLNQPIAQAEYFKMCRSIFEQLEAELGGTWTCIAGEINSLGSFTHFFTNWYIHFTLADKYRFLIYKGAQEIPLKTCQDQSDCGPKDEEIQVLQDEKAALLLESTKLKQELTEAKLELQMNNLEDIKQNLAITEANRETEEALLEVTVLKNTLAETERKLKEVKDQLSNKESESETMKLAINQLTETLTKEQTKLRERQEENTGLHQLLNTVLSSNPPVCL